MERLENARTVIGWFAWSALLITIALGVVRVATAERPPSGAVLLRVSENVSNPVFYLVLALAVLACALPTAVPRARLLALLSAVLTGAGLVFAVVLIALASRASTLILDAGWNLPSLMVCGLSSAVLLGLARRGATAPLAVSESTEKESSERPDVQAAPSPPEQELQPTWLPEDAAGAVWMTAGDAASGASASGWGSSSTGSGWQPGTDDGATDARENTGTGSNSRPEPSD